MPTMTLLIAWLSVAVPRIVVAFRRGAVIVSFVGPGGVGTVGGGTVGGEVGEVGVVTGGGVAATVSDACAAVEDSDPSLAANEKPSAPRNPALGV